MSEDGKFASGGRISGSPKSQMVGDFEGAPLAAGSLFGVRGFDVDKKGYLTGPTYANRFLSGENIAVHETKNDWLMVPPPRRAGLDSLRKAMLERALPHRAGKRWCTCGFYAYYDGVNRYMERGLAQVGGIVEGYGLCTYGERGFRAEKARLVALVKPAAVARRKKFGLWAAWNCVWLAWNLLFTGVDVARGSWGLAAIQTLFTVLSIVCLWASLTPRPRRPHYNDVTRSEWRKVRRHYRDVPVYESLDDAIAAHPLTDPKGAAA